MAYYRIRMWTAVLVTVAAACNGAQHAVETPQGARLTPGSRLVSGSIDDLVHRLRITPAEPSPGDTLEIVSSVINAGVAPAEIGSVICGLDLVTLLDLEPVVPQCDAVGPVRLTLAPGDSARIGPIPVSGGIVRSPPGGYLVRARHLLEPELWTEFEIQVRAR